MNRQKRRAETRKHQLEARNHFHPRGLARSVAHNVMEHDMTGGVNKVKPGTTQSPFSANWRRIAELVSADR